MSIEDTDLVEVLRGGVSYKATGEQLNDYLTPPALDVPFAYFCEPDEGAGANRGIFSKWTATGQMTNPGMNKKIFTYSTWFKRKDYTEKHGFILVGNRADKNAPPPNKSHDSFRIGHFNIMGGTHGTDHGIVLDDYDLSQNCFFQTDLVKTNDWFNLVLSVDTTLATASERVKVYVNNTRIAQTIGNPPALNAESNLFWSNIRNDDHMGYGMNYNPQDNSNTDYIDYLTSNYMSELYYIDGQSLEPKDFSVFGSTNAPKVYEGTYGANGFYLNGLNGSASGSYIQMIDAGPNKLDWWCSKRNVNSAPFFKQQSTVTPTS